MVDATNADQELVEAKEHVQDFQMCKELQEADLQTDCRNASLDWFQCRRSYEFVLTS